MPGICHYFFGPGVGHCHALPAPGNCQIQEEKSANGLAIVQLTDALSSAVSKKAVLS